MTGKRQGPEIPIQTPYTEYILSQDIGKKQDATTSMLYRLTPEYIDYGDGERRVTTFMDVVFMDKRRVSYMELGEYTRELMQAIALGDKCVSIIDGTGIGEAVYDIYTSVGLDPLKIIFTSGETVSVEQKREKPSQRFGTVSGYKVPKVDMVSAAQVVFQQGRIRFAEDIEYRDECFQQLQAFVGKVNEKTHNVKYENLTDEIHDDFVVNILMASWYVKHMGRKLIIPDVGSGFGYAERYGRGSDGYSIDPLAGL